MTAELCNNLRLNLKLLYNDNQFHQAGIGNLVVAIQNKLIRSDKIHWLDRSHDNPVENAFFDMMDEFVRYLNLTCYAGVTGYEFHYTLYEKGSFYHKHIDQFKNNKSRAFSMIIYLNDQWVEKDGGELCIHHEHHEQLVSPLNRKCVFFKSSEIEHEVLLTNEPRLSITGWLKTN